MSERRAGPGLFAGARYPWWGFRFVFRENPGLVRIWIGPVVITFLALSGAAFAAWSLHDDAVDWLWSTPTGDDALGTFLRVVHVVVGWLAGIVLWLVGSVVALMLGSVVAAPFNDALSEAVEELLTGGPSRPFRVSAFVRDVGRTLGMELGKLLAYAAVMLPMWLLSWSLPVVGQILYTVIGLVFSAAYFALDYTDWPAARRDEPIRVRLARARANPAAYLGFGSMVAALLFVPVLNLFLMPAAVAGGTKLFLDLAGDRPPPSGVE